MMRKFKSYCIKNLAIFCVLHKKKRIIMLLNIESFQHIYTKKFVLKNIMRFDE
ncbi:hypothetical protein BD408DRAFT_410973 [Parasitella parasitica]|nr:hypothetical protein BD408DRAFT_410973 [Parasitella parasitica]